MAEAGRTRVSSGVPGLDEVLEGGFLAERACLVRGAPGTGKTTLGLQFLAAGAEAGEPVLFISLEEPEERVRQHAARRAIRLDGIKFLDLSPTSEFFREVETYDIFSPAEVERTPLTQRIVAYVEAERPRRVFLDPITQFRYLTRDPFQFRRQVLSFVRFLTDAGATVLFTSESSPEAPDDDLQFLSDAIILLEHQAGSRSLTVTKLRGSGFRGGPHAVRLDEHGLKVFPRLVPAEHGAAFTLDLLPFGIPELDQMLRGGLERGTVTIISGPSGTGKSTLGMQFIVSAAARGERSLLYAFEEDPALIVHRAENLGMRCRALMQRGLLKIVLVEPLRYSADEFAHMVRQDVEQGEARIVMIDSISGYRLALRGEDLPGHLHALAKYLQRMGAAVLLVNETEHVTGAFRATEAGISFVADNLIFLRYLELQGELRRLIGVLKKRVSGCENTLRELIIEAGGIRVGEPLRGLRGVLQGVPEASA